MLPVICGKNRPGNMLMTLKKQPHMLTKDMVESIMAPYKVNKIHRQSCIVGVEVGTGVRSDVSTGGGGGESVYTTVASLPSGEMRSVSVYRFSGRDGRNSQHAPSVFIPSTDSSSYFARGPFAKTRCHPIFLKSVSQTLLRLVTPLERHLLQ